MECTHKLRLILIFATLVVIFMASGSGSRDTTAAASTEVTPSVEPVKPSLPSPSFPEPDMPDDATLPPISITDLPAVPAITRLVNVSAMISGDFMVNDNGVKYSEAQAQLIFSAKPKAVNEATELTELAEAHPEVTITEDEIIIEHSQPVVKTEPEAEIDEAEVVWLADLIYPEARGVDSVTEQSMIGWTAIDRLLNGHYGKTLLEVITAPQQFCYHPGSPNFDDYGRDLEALARDILTRFYRERNGETNVGRTLPPEFLYYKSDGHGHNIFSADYQHYYYWWEICTDTPYES